MKQQHPSHLRISVFLDENSEHLQVYLVHVYVHKYIQQSPKSDRKPFIWLGLSLRHPRHFIDMGTVAWNTALRATTRNSDVQQQWSFFGLIKVEIHGRKEVELIHLLCAETFQKSLEGEGLSIPLSRPKEFWYKRNRGNIQIQICQSLQFISRCVHPASSTKACESRDLKFDRKREWKSFNLVDPSIIVTIIFYFPSPEHS